MIDKLLESTENICDTTMTEEDIVTEDVCEYDVYLHNAKGILQTLFDSLSSNKEKLGVIVLKIFDLLLEKQIPEIINSIYLDSIIKVIQRTNWQKSVYITIKMQPIQVLQDRYLQMFPFAGDVFLSDGQRLQQA